MKQTTLSNLELKTLCDELAMILRSGISILEGLTIMEEDAASSEGKALIHELNDDFIEKGNLYEALAASKVFPDYMVHMVEIGERSGELDEVMDSLSRYYERQDTLSKSIRSAVTYPLIMLGMMLVIVVVLVTKVMPVFRQVFDQLGVQMTGFSKSVLDLGTVLNTYAVVFALIIVVLAALILFLTCSGKGKLLFAHFVQTFPATRKLSFQIACSRFADGVALMTKSGLDTGESLEIMERSCEHPILKEKISKARSLIEEGSDFAVALNETGIFSGIYARMISVGFRTGAVDEVLRKIADRYEDEINSRIQNLVSILEPTMVAILSIVVGLILLSVMLPLTGIMSSIG